MKRIIFVLFLVPLFVFGVQTVTTQTCIPGARDIVYNGRVLEDAWVTCVRTAYSSVDGYLPIGANVEFERDGMVRVGEVTHYQFTEYPAEWPESSRKPFVYMVTYPGGFAALQPTEILSR